METILMVSPSSSHADRSLSLHRQYHPSITPRIAQVNQGWFLHECWGPRSISRQGWWSVMRVEWCCSLSWWQLSSPTKQLGLHQFVTRVSRTIVRNCRLFARKKLKKPLSQRLLTVHMMQGWYHHQHCWNCCTIKMKSLLHVELLNANN